MTLKDKIQRIEINEQYEEYFEFSKKSFNRLVAVIFIAAIILGWLGNDIFRMYSNKKTLDGLWLPQNISTDEAREYAESRDTVGSWICVNIKGMTIQEMINTCEHEAAHEIFAQKCSSNATDCLDKVGIK